jgi:hypothetical protein
MATTVRGLVVGDVEELCRCLERNVPDGDHEHHARAVFGLGVAGEAVAKHEDLACWRSDDAVAGLYLGMSRGRGPWQYVRQSAVAPEDRQGEI